MAPGTVPAISYDPPSVTASHAPQISRNNSTTTPLEDGVLRTFDSRVEATSSGTQTPTLEPVIIPYRPVSSSDIVSITSVPESTQDVHTGKTWASSVGRYHGKEDPWLPLILTLDGGGIRGYSSLLILKELTKQIAFWENKLEKISNKRAADQKVWNWEAIQPCLYFDFMYGTSTGGLIATMLGRLRMTVPACLKLYGRVGNDLFGVRRSRIPLATKYKHEPLERAVKEIVQQNCPHRHRGQKGAENGCAGTDWHPWDLDQDGNETAHHEPLNKDSVDRFCHRYVFFPIRRNTPT